MWNILESIFEQEFLCALSFVLSSTLLFYAATPSHRDNDCYRCLTLEAFVFDLPVLASLVYLFVFRLELRPLETIWHRGRTELRSCRTWCSIRVVFLWKNTIEYPEITRVRLKYLAIFYNVVKYSTISRNISNKLLIYVRNLQFR